MPRRWRTRVQDVLDACLRVETYVHGLDETTFADDWQAVEAVAFNLLLIGEASAHVPEEVVERTPEIPWRPMRAMRNLLAHQYFDLDVGIVWRTATGSLPPPVSRLRALLEEEA